MKLRVKTITDKRAYCFCPFHKDENPSLEVTLEGEYQRKYYCHGCGIAGVLNQREFDKLMVRQNKGYKKKKHKANIDWNKLSEEYHNNWINTEGCYSFIPFKASPKHLIVMGMGWDEEAFTFPMRNEFNEVIGIHRRFPDGFKCAVDGSRNGLFIPQISFSIKEPLFICEGVSDTVTILDLGFQAIGRPNNNSCNDMLLEWGIINRTSDGEVLPLVMNDSIYVVADNDAAGIRGAELLAEYLDLRNTNIILPKEKDIREEVEKQGKEKTILFIKANLREHLNEKR